MLGQKIFLLQKCGQFMKAGVQYYNVYCVMIST